MRQEALQVAAVAATPLPEGRHCRPVPGRAPREKSLSCADLYGGDRVEEAPVLRRALSGCELPASGFGAWDFPFLSNNLEEHDI